ncbi:MAG TPA: hypothetical protein VLE89_01150, partial [Chlamydiales bacterium]|nr:hypothetical protein [Chlamydiales bacterium]
CDYVYDEEDATLDPAAVQPGSAIFVKTDMIDLFFREIHPRLAHPYVLVSHNSDHPAPGPNQALLDDPKLIAWFAQNVEAAHPKLHPIPIGIANRYWGHGNPEVLQNAIAKPKSKQHLLYFNFTIQNYHAERWPLFHLFGYAPFSYRPGKRRFDIYLNDLSSSKFILAPRGNGLDTHRLWEALYLDSFPIVKTSPLDAVYDGLPVIVIQEWEEVTESFLNQKYDEFTHASFSLDRRYLPYWLSLIAQAKTDALNYGL